MGPIAPLFADIGDILGAIVMIVIVVLSLIGQAMGGNKDKAKKQAGRRQGQGPAVDEVRRELGESRQAQSRPQQRPRQPIRPEPVYVDDDSHSAMNDHQVGTISNVEVGTLGERHLQSSGLGERITQHDAMLDAGLVEHPPEGTESFGVARAGAPRGEIATHIVEVLSDPQRVTEAIILAEVLRPPTDRW